MRSLVLAAYVLGDLATLVYLIFFDGTKYTWWNWLIIVPVDVFLATIWPIYWAVLNPYLH